MELFSENLTLSNLNLEYALIPLPFQGHRYKMVLKFNFFLYVVLLVTISCKESKLFIYIIALGYSGFF